MWVCSNNTFRRGQACVAYPYIGAMRRPELWDGHVGTYSHVFFLFHLNSKTLLLTSQMGSDCQRRKGIWGRPVSSVVFI